MAGEFRVFITGATGYIGGQVLVDLLGRHDADKFRVTALVRDQVKAKKIEELGAGALIADLDDAAALKKAASESDVVFHLASADHKPSAEALVAGLAERKAKTGKKGIYFHTSGTAIIMDFVFGESVSDKVTSDLDVDALEAIPDTAPHRDVDKVAINAGAKGDVDVYLVVPPTIYGISAGPFHKTSIQIPALIRAAIKSGTSHYVGKGVPIWSKISIAELSGLYLFLMDHALARANSGSDGPHRFENYFFSETGEYSWKETAEAIGKSLAARGVIKSAAPKPFPGDETTLSLLGPYGKVVWGSNSRSRADRARQLGWKPKGKTADFSADIDAEVAWIVANEHGNTTSAPEDWLKKD